MAIGWIDLHTHTTASDGSLTPTELVEVAVTAGLLAVGITDHDTANGIDEALEAGVRRGIRVVPGIEITCPATEGTLHILGYGIDHTETRFAEGLEWLKQARSDRNPKIIENLRRMGIPISMEDVEARAGGDLIGRPHIALTMVDLGVVASVEEAFTRFLADEAPAYEYKAMYDTPTAFELIRGAGGIAVMAHPCQTGLEGEALRELVARLRDEGLEGIEVYYTHHTQSQTDFYLELAREFDLVPTGGTDFHGEIMPGIEIGIGTGDLRVPLSCLEGIDRRIAGLTAQLS